MSDPFITLELILPTTMGGWMHTETAETPIIDGVRFTYRKNRTVVLGSLSYYELQLQSELVVFDQFREFRRFVLSSWPQKSKILERHPSPACDVVVFKYDDDVRLTHKELEQIIGVCGDCGLPGCCFHLLPCLV